MCSNQVIRQELGLDEQIEGASADAKRRPGRPGLLEHELRAVSVDGEAVELARATGGDEARRSAITAHMRRVP